MGYFLPSPPILSKLSTVLPCAVLPRRFGINFGALKSWSGIKFFGGVFFHMHCLSVLLLRGEWLLRRSRVPCVGRNGLGSIIHYIDSISSCYADYGSCLLTSSKTVGSTRCSSPPEDWVKINCDVKVGFESMCTVANSRDHKESILWVATNLLNFSDPLIGEVVACLLAMEIATARHHNFVMVESDSKTVIKNLTGAGTNWGIDNYVRQCK
ncbi:hypothetical protein CsatB_000519 [Cannabis sativa]